MLVDCKRYLKTASVDSQGQHSSIYVFVYLCVVCLFVSVFELTRVDTCTETTYVLVAREHMTVMRSLFRDEVTYDTVLVHVETILVKILMLHCTHQHVPA